MLHDPARHEPLTGGDWDEGAARRAIDRIVRDAEARFSPESYWPTHPLDAEGGDRGPAFDLYFGAAGVIWALDHLAARGTVALRRSYDDHLDTLPALNRAWLASEGVGDAGAGSYLVGETGILLVGYARRPSAEKAARLEALVAGNLDHPARELMWGAPGTMLASLFLHRRTGERRWADLFVASARKLWSQLLWSEECRCRYWSQQLGPHRLTSLGGVHGFVATVAPVIRGRDLLPAGEWDAWQRCIVETVRATAQREGDRANWRPDLESPGGSPQAQKRLLQICHGAPGFLVCLADLPTGELDDLFVAAGETIWAAGPLRKGSNLCHGTGGNGYALLKLFERTRDLRWLARARAFAMHGIAQTETFAWRFGQMRYSLWTGDPGFAIYVDDCIRGTGSFPTLETFFPPSR
jgi:hypothetical protein